uniref:Uncharacterized protein n=1 Tax=Meloidogyne enterolobii TaxID=390850 RepID=A0A6V7ULL7_MELEN|nr:unnamed protein product [Meloidogyne enterolobii]
MELYLFRPERWQELYNCSKINISDVPLEERYHPLNGIIIILLFILFEILYTPCVYSIYKHRELSCYKFLFFIGIVDMAMLFLHGLATGIYCFTSEMFCSHPNFNFILGTFGTCLFSTQSCAHIFLALDRCADSYSTKISDFFFSGTRTWIWIFCSFLFGIYNFLFISPGLYNGIYMNWFENPYFGYSIEINLKEYVNFVNLWYDLFFAFGFPAIYLFFIVMFCIRLKEIKAIANIEQRKLKMTVKLTK